MSETEKITINLGPVDLGRIDVLVEQGLYSNRTDLIRTAIRNQLDRHEKVIQDHAVKWSFVVGAETVSRSTLEKLQTKGKQVSLRVIGSLTLAEDIDPDLARATIKSVFVSGSFHAPGAVRDALADRINSRGLL
ncbi:CopG family transcriptional regulator [Candidatus Bipolaricaulota bacterium]|nr:CopG family transcriptional regulator [Candidatus Bipolaricaulota bacterium]